MKKFYSLALAAAVAAGSLSASAQQFTFKKDANFADEAIATSVKASSNVTASYLKEHGTLSHRADRNLVGTYFLSAEAPGGPVMDAFTITAGTEANKYVINNFFWGEDAAPLQAEYIAGTIEGTFYEFLVIPGGQEWATLQGTKIGIFAGVKNSSGQFGALSDENDEYIDLEFLLSEEDGELIGTPAWSLKGYTSGLTWLFIEGDKAYKSGNCFTSPEFYPSNATFTANWLDVNTENYVPLNAPAYAYTYRQQGKDVLEVAGITTDRLTCSPISLVVAADGTATATNAETGIIFTLQDNSQVPAYFMSESETASNPTVSATVTVGADKTTVNFGEVLFMGLLLEGKYQSVRLWAEPVITINRAFDIAGVENIAADVEDLNAPVEYYNLQGIRVAQPEAGQLLIQRQGNKATKVVIR